MGYLHHTNLDSLLALKGLHNLEQNHAEKLTNWLQISHWPCFASSGVGAFQPELNQDDDVTEFVHLRHHSSLCRDHSAS